MISRHEWFKLKKDFPYMINSINYNFLTSYYKNIFNPVVAKKKQHIDTFKWRSDYNQFKVLDNMNFLDSI